MQRSHIIASFAQTCIYSLFGLDRSRFGVRAVVDGRQFECLSPGGFLNSFAFADLTQEPFVGRHQPGYFTFELIVGNP